MRSVKKSKRIHRFSVRGVGRALPTCVRYAISGPVIKRRSVRVWAGFVALAIIGALILELSVNVVPASAATGNIMPDADVTRGWASCTGTGCTTAHYTTLDEGTTAVDTDYVNTGTSGSGGEIEEYTMQTINGISTASSVAVTIRNKTPAINGGAADTVSVNLRVNGTLQTAQTCTAVTTSFVDCAKTFTGSWSQSDLDSMQVQLTRNVLGSGTVSTRDDDVQVSNVYATVTYSTPAQYTQGSSRWFANADGTSLNTAMNWQTATTTAAWQAGREFGGYLNYNGKLWAISGSNATGWNSDVTSSVDGINWTTVKNNLSSGSGFTPRNLFASTVFDGKMWVIGGWDNTARSTSAYYSTDGVTWTLGSSSAYTTGTQQSAIAVFKGKMYVMGGYSGSASQVIRTTTDGVTWSTASTPSWPARQGAVAVVYNGAMYIMGGNSGTSDLNDVWKTTDGSTWTRVDSGSVAWSGRTGASVVVMEGKMWLMGGESGSTHYKDLYYSTDGSTWTTATAPGWATGLSGFGAVIYNNKLWVYAGSNGATPPTSVYYAMPTTTPATNPLAALKAQDTPVSVSWGNGKIRLRMNLGVSSGSGDKGTGVMQLQYATRGSDGSCDTSFTGENYYKIGTPNFVQQTASASWSARNGIAGTYYNGKLWMIGGDTAGGISNQVYSSSDNGATWTSVGTIPVARSAATVTVYNGKMYVIGGNNGSTVYGTMYSSTDGANWTSEPSLPSSALRTFHQTVVFNNKIYVLGGMSNFSGTGDTNTVYSFDGTSWTTETAAPWTARDSHTATVMNGKIYVMGGINGTSNYLNDVWMTSDGSSWTQLNPAAWSERQGLMSATINNVTYVIGGQSSTARLADIWSTTDGENWNQLSDSGVGTRAFGGVAIVNDQIVIMGGDASSGTQRNNDVWMGGPDIDFYDNPTADTGASISTMTGDPTAGGTILGESYNEGDTFTNDNNAIASGQYGVWDFPLQVKGGFGKTFCFRTYNLGTGANLSSYSTVPQLTSCVAPPLEAQMRHGKTVCGGANGRLYWAGSGDL